MNILAADTPTLADNAIVKLQTHEILYLLIILIIGTVYLTLEFKNKRLSGLATEENKKFKAAEFAKTPYEKSTPGDLEKIINKISNNYRIVITIYGVLLAFVVSDKLSSTLSNWSFLIWTGWIIAIIIRAGMHLYELSDIMERDYQLTYMRRTVFGANQFFKFSLIFFAIGIALLPSFFFIEAPTIAEIKDLPWNISLSIFSGAFAILLITFVFYLMLWLFSAQFKDGILNLFTYSLMLIGISAVNAFSTISPLTPVSISLLGQKFLIPSAFYHPFFYTSTALFGSTIVRGGRILFYYFRYLRK